VRLPQKTHAHSLSSLQNSPGPGVSLDTNRDKRRFEGNRREGTRCHADWLPSDNGTNGRHPAWKAPVGVSKLSAIGCRHHRSHWIASCESSRIVSNRDKSKIVPTSNKQGFVRLERSSWRAANSQ
jgi:hypothetical protein